MIGAFRSVLFADLKLLTSPGRWSIYMLFALWGVAGCTNLPTTTADVHLAESLGQAHLAEHAAEEAVSPGLAVEEVAAHPFRILEGNLLCLQKEALGQAFLLFSRVSDTTDHPMPFYTSGRRVRFERLGDEIALFDMHPSVAYQAFYSEKLVQRFAVRKELADCLVFSWQQGLTYYIDSSPIGVGEEEHSHAVLSDQPAYVIPLQDSMVLAINPLKEGITFTQIAIASFAKQGKAPAYVDSVYVRTSIVRLSALVGSPLPAPPSLDNMGTFEVAYRHQQDRTIQKSMTGWQRLVEGKQVAVYLSEAIPTMYLPVVLEGVAYWNRIAGRDVFQPYPNSPVDRIMDVDEIMIHWVDWLEGNVAYAHFQTDPETGGIVQGLMYLPSSFAALADWRLSMQTGAIAQIEPAVVGQSLWAQQHGLHDRFLSVHDLLMVEPVAMDLETLQRLAQANLRLVVAHELGHLLGFRHNFAGSMDTVIHDSSLRDCIFSAYLEDSQHVGAATSNSVMDYLDPIDSALLGTLILQDALPYDKAVFTYLYEQQVGEALANTTKPLFCTDGKARAGRLFGCALFDSGSDPLASVMEKIKHREKMATILLHLVLQDLTQLGQAHQTLEQVLLAIPIRSILLSFIRMQLPMLGWWENQDVLTDIAVEQKYGGWNIFNKRDFRQENRKAIYRRFRSIGGDEGIWQALFAWNEDGSIQLGWMKDGVDKELQTPAVQQQLAHVVDVATQEKWLGKLDMPLLTTYLYTLADEMESEYHRIMHFVLKMYDKKVPLNLYEES